MIRIFNSYKMQAQELTQFCTSINICGSLSEIARKLEASMFYKIWDKHQINKQVGVGNLVWATLEGKEIFRGIVIDRSINANEELNFTAFDLAYYLTKNKVTRNFKNTTVMSAVQDICKEVGVRVDSLSNSNIKINRLIAQKTVYDAIMELYTQVSKQTGRRFYILMTGVGLNVPDIGAFKCDKVIKPCKDVFTADGNLLNLGFKDSMGNMINRIKVYDDKNNLIDTIQNVTMIKSYGVLQDNYVKEEDKNYKIVANNMIHDVDTEIECEVLGNYEYLTGREVTVQVPFISKLANRKMYVNADTHTWDVETGTFATQLTLSFSKDMDLKEE
ncbi:XkdQ/YqbQ family protein [Clostridium ihumii]|uniref:XkdQ/YqbQ family protein n=1 Tax=Clostridium ihumii TaxID=1470356 RepID=UPI00055058E0|nr:hypothetical protein [Clostridium ihumii]